MTSSTCSPNHLSEKSNTCYTLNQLKNIEKNYNKEHTDKINLNLKKDILWNTLKQRNFKNCNNNEFCWLKQNYMQLNTNLNKFKKNFRPEKPIEWDNNPTMWLNTINILNVMNQYQYKYKDFKFVGVFPIDFSTKIGKNCVSPEMCNININELLENNINKLGFVFNLDKHWQSGSHWTSLYINIDPKSNQYGAYYYDSISNRPPQEIYYFINFIKSQIKKIKKFNLKKFNFVYNKIKHQNKSTECGMFSIFFLDKCLKKISFDKIVNNTKLNDDLVFKYRDKYFTKVN